MDITTTIVATSLVNLIMFPLLLWLIERFIGKRLDRMDSSRENARLEMESEARDSRLWRQAMEAGMRSLLRAEIVSEHRKWMKRGYCPLESKEYLTRNHAAYKGLGGNDIGDSLYEQVMKLPTKERTEE